VSRVSPKGTKPAQGSFTAGSKQLGRGGVSCGTGGGGDIRRGDGDKRRKTQICCLSPVFVFVVRRRREICRSDNFFPRDNCGSQQREDPWRWHFDPPTAQLVSGWRGPKRGGETPAPPHMGSATKALGENPPIRLERLSIRRREYTPPRWEAPPRPPTPGRKGGTIHPRRSSFIPPDFGIPAGGGQGKGFPAAATRKYWFLAPLPFGPNSLPGTISVRAAT